MQRTFKIQKRKRKASTSRSARRGLPTWIRNFLPTGGRLLRLDKDATKATENEPAQAPLSPTESVTNSESTKRDSLCMASIEAALPDTPTKMAALPLAPSAHHLPPYMINMLHHSANNSDISTSSANQPLEVELRYPSGYTERFLLPQPTSNRPQKDRTLHPIDDLITTINVILHLTTGPIGPHTKLCPILQTAYTTSDLPLFTTTLATLNHHLSSPLKLTRPTPSLIHHFLAQLYSRSVAPHLKPLTTARSPRKPTSAIYGELQPPFLSSIFKQTSLSPGQTYLDLGSGVGNTALQAALETGATAHGIEREEFPHLVSALHLQQFHIRCMLWGLKPGKVQLYNADFLNSPHLTDHLLPEVDVVVVNNFRFEPETELGLGRLLEGGLRVGARVVSMRPIWVGKLRSPRRGAEGEEDGNGMWKVEECAYAEGSVSWSQKEGVYWVSTKLR
ncbi:hypothetical protein PRZ48_006291 [Zasmidium cellare]|uniref:Histone-lysine N-methyltransferase, H3 lysine-79 specific n=1 Tax=Zasmidium cellare TaxID=395010 RepID=A0ABR0EN21_ZASCE|nr:hypothetical protein PRZ48_006291 [Zasmidium cellare]